jgi:methionyl-tRNA formyltransferase
MRVIFAGSPEPAVPVLRALVDSHHDVVLVVTREDRPKGRSKTPVPTPVGAVAEELGIPTLKPSSINTPESLQVLRDADAGALAVAAFGQILKDDVLTGWPCINVHYSLLPAYRGAAPVEVTHCAAPRAHLAAPHGPRPARLCRCLRVWRPTRRARGAISRLRLFAARGPET